MISFMKTLLEITIYSSIVMLFVLLIKSILGKRLNTKVISFLWALVIIRLLLPITFTAPTHINIFFLPLEKEITQSTTPIVEQNEQITNNNYDMPSTQDHSLNIEANSNFSAAPSLTPSPTAFQKTWDYVKTLNLWTYSFLIWLIGVAFLLFKSLYKITCLHIKIMSCKNIICGVMKDFLMNNKKILGITQNVHLISCNFVDVPVAYGTINPKILMPVGYEQKMELNKLNLIIMHELCHIKKMDIAKNYLWLIAKIIYWFNPLVILAYKAFTDDLEFSCDEMVLNHIPINKKFNYSQSLVDVIKLASGDLTQSTPITLSFLKDKSNLAKRVKNMIKPQKKLKSASFLTILFALILIVGCFTTACQPKTESPVIQSDNNSEQETVEQTPQQNTEQPTVINTFSAPETWVDETHKETNSMYINANVAVPVDTWGLYELVPQTTTKDDFQKILTAIIDNTPIYSNQRIESKADLEREIERYGNSIVEFQKIYDQRIENNEPSPTPSPDGPLSILDLSNDDLLINIDIFTKMIEEAKQKLLIAKDEEYEINSQFNIDVMFSDLSQLTLDELLDAGLQLEPGSASPRVYVNGEADLGNKTPANISFSYSENNFELYFANFGSEEQGFSSGVTYLGQDLFECNISVDDAAAIAGNKVKELGYDYLDIDAVQFCQYTDRDKRDGDKFPECYEFVFTRKMDGATATYAFADGAVLDENPESGTPHWDNCEIIIRVNDSGIIGIEIETMKSDVIRQTYGVEFLDLSQIMEIFKEQLFVLNSYYNGKFDSDRVIARELHIDEIRLGYLAVPSDDMSKLIYIPVWDFFGEEIATYTDGIGGDLGESLDENNQRRNDLLTESVLTINAIDGTIVDRGN